ncbi:right-handed parallel beta-helix repeat-containing protein [Azonexus fungiphilus]|uniref:right-handed parallel beta-helix repeat-containing protein n=1 Tax=Azonexus fungiphilus TaxID=146940 RepID=UPI00156B04B9|nr:right-handed parallel beta-helix repeat-containing protein [Azonexus fungiphilus]NHC07550.1 right-handed parallel beta-helix repeat-containing protein [Azonexus fungiphilus]
MINCLRSIKICFALSFFLLSGFSLADDFAIDIRGKKIINAKEFGYGVDRFVLDSAFQDILNSLSDVVFVIPPGYYTQGECLTVGGKGIYLVGYGVVIEQVNPDSQCLVISGEGNALIGFRLDGNAISRGNSTKQAAVVVKGKGSLVIGNRISRSKSAAIWVQGAENYKIYGNYIDHSYSDGIHQTEGSFNGVVKYNHTYNTGDDGISVVSYSSSGLVHDIVIENNIVTNVKWARGISVIGGENVVVRSNFVNGTGRAAGIIVSREESYRTRGVRNVTIEGNFVSGVSMIEPGKINDLTGQGAIDINSHNFSEPGVEKVTVAKNTVIDSKHSPIRVLGNVCDVSVINLQSLPLVNEDIVIHNCEGGNK